MFFYPSILLIEPLFHYRAWSISSQVTRREIEESLVFVRRLDLWLLTSIHSKRLYSMWFIQSEKMIFCWIKDTCSDLYVHSFMWIVRTANCLHLPSFFTCFPQLCWMPTDFFTNVWLSKRDQVKSASACIIRSWPEAPKTFYPLTLFTFKYDHNSKPQFHRTQ